MFLQSVFRYHCTFAKAVPIVARCGFAKLNQLTAATVEEHVISLRVYVWEASNTFLRFSKAGQKNDQMQFFMRQNLHSETH